MPLIVHVGIHLNCSCVRQTYQCFSEKLPFLAFLLIVPLLLNFPTLHHLSGVTETRFSPIGEQRSANQRLVKPQSSVFSCKPVGPRGVQAAEPCGWSVLVAAAGPLGFTWKLFRRCVQDTGWIGKSFSTLYPSNLTLRARSSGTCSPRVAVSGRPTEHFHNSSPLPASMSI